MSTYHTKRFSSSMPLKLLAKIIPWSKYGLLIYHSFFVLFLVVKKKKTPQFHCNFQLMASFHDTWSVLPYAVIIPPVSTCSLFPFLTFNTMQEKQIWYSPHVIYALSNIYSREFTHSSMIKFNYSYIRGISSYIEKRSVYQTSSLLFKLLPQGIISSSFSSYKIVIIIIITHASGNTQGPLAELYPFRKKFCNVEHWIF
jgi:hypothetical protein